MTADLRARIAEALEECRVLTPDAQADAVMAVVQPELDRQRIRMQRYSRGRCRICGATDPDFPWPEHRRRPHAMHCRLYVGPLEHEKRGGRPGVLGIGWRNDCTCGRSYSDEDGRCPDAAVDWRGPRPDGGKERA